MNLTRHTHEVCLIILNSGVPYCINNVTFLYQMAVTKPMALLTWLLMAFNTHSYKTLCFIGLINHGSRCSPSELL